MTPAAVTPAARPWKVAPTVYPADRLQELPWAGQTGPLAAVRHRFQVRCSHDPLRDLLCALEDLGIPGEDGCPSPVVEYSLIDRGVLTAREQRRRYVLYRDQQRLGYAGDPDRLMALLLRWVAAGAERDLEHLLLRASAVQLGGTTALLVGPGHSQTADALVAEGAALLALRTVALTPSAEVQPLLLPSYRADREGVGAWQRAGSVATVASPVELLVLLSAEPAAPSRAAACLQLAQHAPNLGAQADALAMLADVARGAAVHTASGPQDAQLISTWGAR